ncbi:unnamed protein product [Anisakis simplex]|uniref:Cadherin domain-containing protein n=1 Tax=Anisakis simplex TaxID=6269 RepID=A0A3P6NH02_ANISI|nr:unnamed protein product [Anisakis simplex]
MVDRAMPIFTHRIYRCHINENAPIGSTLHTVKAISNMNKQIGYILKSGDPSKRFRVDFNSGAVSVHRPLDREQCATYNLTVMAIDVTRDGVHSECTVVVTIDDINDNPPRFEMPFYEVHVSEAAHIGTQILKVTAHDPDSTVTTVSYGLNGANSSSKEVSFLMF